MAARLPQPKQDVGRRYDHRTGGSRSLGVALAHTPLQVEQHLTLAFETGYYERLRPKITRTNKGDGFAAMRNVSSRESANIWRLTLYERSALSIESPWSDSWRDNLMTDQDLDFEPLIISLEEAIVTPRGIVQISGWAAGFSAVEELRILVGGYSLGEPEVGVARPDVSSAYPDFVNADASGFMIKTAISDELLKHPEVTVTVRLTGGITRAVTKTLQQPAVIRRSRDAARQVHHWIERALLTVDGLLRIDGWVLCADTVVKINVLLDGQPGGEATYGLSRPDVGNAHPAIPSARNSGFKFEAKAPGTWSGEHLITLSIITRSGADHVLPIPVLAQEAAQEPTQEMGGAEGRIRFHVDNPAVSLGVATEPVRGMLAIGGWAISSAGIDSVDVLLDDKKIGAAYYGVRRMDINTAFPDWPNSLLSGFAMTLPRKMLTSEQHGVRVVVRDKQGEVREAAFSIAVDLSAEDGQQVGVRDRAPQSEIDLKLSWIRNSKLRPYFWIAVLMDAEEDTRRLRQTLGSLRRQAYGEFCILPVARDAQGVEAIQRLADELGLPVMASEQLFGYGRLADMIAASQAPDRDPWFMALRCGDRLGVDALLEFGTSAALQPEASFIYGDDRRFDEAARGLSPFLKPEWSPELLLSTNYIGCCWCVSTRALAQAEIRYDDLLASGEYDLILRLTERSANVAHTPVLLAQREKGVGDSEDQERAALSRALGRRNIEGEVLPGVLKGVFRARRDVKTEGLVSIVMPTIAARGLVKIAIESIRKLTAYRHFEIICIDNIKDPDSEWKPWFRENADKVVEILEPFNWSRFNNVGAEAASGEFLLFLNDDIEVLDPYWLHVLLEHAQREEVGVVGPRLLYPDLRVQHAGMYLAAHDARHAFRFLDEGEAGPFGLAGAQRDMIAVTGACMLMRKTTFEAVGRFNEAHKVVNNDLDFCLKIGRSGKSVVYTPHTRLIHHELASRAKLEDVFDESFAAEWRSVFTLGDPFFHPGLSTDVTNYEPDPEPTRLICAGRPLLAREQVKRILVMKLDHVGDFITAFPGIQRLKLRFPKAEIHVLVPKASTLLAHLEPAIVNVIEFNFFSAVSQEGRLEVTEEQLSALAERLRAFDFDIAIDMRKHSDTRSMLKRTGARLLAGFDSRGEHPFLDVALEWEGDPSCRPKRSHIADDYVSLIESVASACNPSRQVLGGPSRVEAIAAVRALPGLGEMTQGLFDRKVTCIHPAAGNDLRQWPPGHFAALIDLLTELAQMNVMIIGAENERPIVDAVLESIVHTEGVYSLVGKTGLRDLPLVLRAADLFVGNNSGPHHIAAALGVPTIGVHSGVVSSHEWGPLGPSAVALQREMNCGPCYIETPANCHRDMACLRGLKPGEVFRICRMMLG